MRIFQNGIFWNINIPFWNILEYFGIFLVTFYKKQIDKFILFLLENIYFNLKFFINNSNKYSNHKLHKFKPRLHKTQPNLHKKQ